MKKIWVIVSVLVALGLLVGAIAIGCGEVQKQKEEVVVETGGASGSSVMGGSSIKTYGGVRSSSVKAMAAGTLSGYIYDAVTNNPIQGVQVSVSPTNFTTTNAQGYYSLSGVAAGDIVVSTHSPISGSFKPVFHDYQNISIATSAQNVDFYLYPFLSYYTAPTGTLNITMTDINSNPLSNVDGLVYSNKYWTSEKYFKTDINGQASFTDIPAGEVIITGGGLLGGGYTIANVTAGAATASTLIIPFDQGTIGGTVSIPSGLSLWGAQGGPPLNGPYTLAGIPSGTLEVSSYTVKVPPGGGYNLRTVAASSDYKKQSYAFGSNITISTGETITKNVALPAPPASVSVATSESGGYATLTVSWQKPSGWTPDYYMVGYTLLDASDFTAILSRGGITTGTSIQLVFANEVSLDPDISHIAVAAIKSSGIDINNMNLKNIKISKMATQSL